MKKLLALAILSSIFLAKPCFGVDWIKDRIYISLSSIAVPPKPEIGYHYTDSIKISIEPIAVLWMGAETQVGRGFVTKFHYHHKLNSTCITPYVNVGTGVIITSESEDDPTEFKNDSLDFFIPYQVSAGVNIPLSSRTSLFAGYKVQRLLKFSRGFEFGLSFNL